MIKLLVISPKFGQHYIIIDEEDYAEISKYKLWIAKNKETYYGMLYEPKYPAGTQLHKFLMRPTGGKAVDHINGNGLDNRRSNLRLVTPIQNARNSIASKKDRASPYKGVFKHRKKWMARITFRRKDVYLGSFTTQEEAARAYNEAVLKYHKEYGVYNDIEKKEIIRYPEWLKRTNKV